MRGRLLKAPVLLDTPLRDLLRDANIHNTLPHREPLDLGCTNLTLDFRTTLK